MPGAVLLISLEISGQQITPFQGQGDSPPAEPTEVFVSAYLERLLAVDVSTYRFSVREKYFSATCRFVQNNNSRAI